MFNSRYERKHYTLSISSLISEVLTVETLQACNVTTLFTTQNITKDTVKLDQVIGNKSPKIKRSANQKNEIERRKLSKNIGANKIRISSCNSALSFTLATSFLFFIYER